MIIIKKIKIPDKLKPTLIFLLVFTLCFIIFKLTFLLTLPFLIALTVALCMRPINKFMKNKLSFKRGFAATIITSFIFVSVLGLIFWVLFILINELISFVTNFSFDNITSNETFNKYIGEIAKYFDIANASKLMELFGANMNSLKSVYDIVMKIVSSIPAIVTLIIVAVFATYYFTIEFDKIANSFLNLFPKKTSQRILEIYHESKTSVNKCLKSFFIIYFLTFIESLFVFMVLGIKYPVFFAIVSMIADVIPILGPGTVYVPLAIVYFIQGRFFIAAVLMITWAAISIIRQIIEPKIISSSIKIHPLLVITALYLSLYFRNFWILVYLMTVTILYQVLVKSGVLYPLSEIKLIKQN